MFTNKQKLTALSICHIFETAKPLGDSTTIAVLNDRAGISYGIPQATHKSGNLADVIERYISGNDEPLYEPLFRKYLPQMRKSDQRTVDKLAADSELKRALKEAGSEPAMRKAQLDNVNSRMNKAVRACDGSGWKSTMALAVVYDSINHGSWEKIRDKVDGGLDEKSWIKAYVRARHNWLGSIARLKVTQYRTAFFNQQIAENNWDLKLPMRVHGFNLTVSHISKAESETNEINSLQGANDNNYVQDTETETETKVETETEEVVRNASNRNEDTTAEANASINVESGDQAKIDAARSQNKPIDIQQTPKLDLWGKVSAGVTAIFTGAWIIPNFDLSNGQLRVVEMIFPYLMVGLLIALPAWYGIKKWNNYHLTKLQVTINSDTTRKDVNIIGIASQPLDVSWFGWAKVNVGWLVAGLLVIINLIAILAK